jgi:hypothetical protein
MAEPILLIRQDTDPSDPRKDYDHLGTMATWHGRYTLGDVQPKERPAEYRKANLPKGSIELPLFLFDHSGLSISTDDSTFRACDSQGWDWGQLGFIYTTPEKIRKKFECQKITLEIKKKVIAGLVAEVEQYNDFLNGNVWGYIYKKPKHTCESCGHVEWEEDSCWGFYGSDLKDSGLAEMIPQEAKPLLEAAWEKRFETHE